MSAMSGQPDGSGFGSPERLDRAHAVVAEEADRAARERRQVGQRRLAVARDLRGRERVGVAPVRERPAQDAARLVADERPAPDPLALLGRLEQEGGPRPPQLEEGGHRRLAVGDERLADRDEVVVAGELADLVERRPDRAAQLRVSGDGH
jgi:hypothetical protein